MNDKPRKDLPLAALFIVCAIPGLCAFLVGSVLVFEGTWQRNIWVAALGILLGMAGALLVLVGTARWGQWGYVLIFFVFLAGMPAALFLDPPVGPGDKGLDAILRAGFAAFLTSMAVNYYYRRKRKRAAAPPA